jgi:RimJ/RimL family protein N-acetyltransferase
MSITLNPDIDDAVRNFYQNGTSIIFETKDLILRPVQENDRPFFDNLYLDYETMKLFNTTEKDYKELGPDQWKKEQLEEAAERVATFVDRWNKRNPFSGFMICKKPDSLPIGYIVSGLGKSGRSVLGFVIKKEEQRNGFGTQAVHAMVQRYLPALIATHYKLFGTPLLISGAPFKEVQATSRVDNDASQKVLSRARMKRMDGSKQEDGMERCLYSLQYENPP